MNQQNNRAYPPRSSGERRPQGQGVRPPQGQTRRPPQGQSIRTASQRPAQTRRPAPQNSAPHRSAPAAGILPRGLLMLIAGGVVAILLAYFLQKAWPNGFPLSVKKASEAATAQTAITEIHSGGPIRINEIMTDNANTLSAEDGSAPDWIEIINTGKTSVDLSGYSIAKSANASTVFTFPAVSIAPDECILIYADSRLRETAGEEYHAPFRISSKGDVLMLFNDSGTAIDTVNVPALQQDHSYMRRDTSTWVDTDQCTPGMTNTEESYRKLTEKADYSPVIITEIMASNRSTYPDENGSYYDYIEIYNQSGDTVDLTNWHLSDDSAVIRKWTFPSMTIAPGQYIVIFASKLDRKDDVDHLHTNFSLSSEGEEVVLSSAGGQIMDSVSYDLLKRNEAWSLMSDGTWSSAAAPTPGSANQ